MNAPLYNYLIELSNRPSFYRFHMPGHKGLPCGSLFDSVFSIDYTEVPETGNLYIEGGIIQQAEALTADFYGADRCFFLTCGATQGIKSAIAAFCTDKLLIDRNCHKSVQDGCAVLGLDPYYISPEFLPEFGITGHISLSAFEQALTSSGAQAAIVTSPTYYGCCLDIKALSQICHSHGARLIVDSAHGSHMESCGCQSAVRQGVDAVIFSAHKTLMAMGQGAYLLMNGQTDETYLSARRATSLFGTTSPSYAIMASLDYGRAFAQEHPDLYAEITEKTMTLREDIAKNTNVIVFPSDDPLRLTLNFAKLGMSGYTAAQYFRAKGAEPEMADDSNVVFIITAADTAQSLCAVYAGAQSAHSCGKPAKAIVPAVPPPIPKRAISPREAALGASEHVDLGDSVGRICAQSIAPYPPGVAVITPGEIINKNCIEYLLKKGYNEATKVLVRP